MQSVVWRFFFYKNSFEELSITDSVLSSIGAFEIMVFQNSMEKLDISKQQ